MIGKRTDARRYRTWLVVTSVSILTAGCGGGGSNIGSTPAPPTASPAPPPPPAPTNTSITDLKVSQTLTNDAATTNVGFNLISKTTISGRAAPEALTVRYDAPTNSYSVSSSAFSENFTPADRQPDRSLGEALYRHASSGVTSYLTLVTTPYSGPTSNKYVGMGYLQRNAVSGDRQDTSFTTFDYGFETAASAVPRATAERARGFSETACRRDPGGAPPGPGEAGGIFFLWAPLHWKNRCTHAGIFESNEGVRWHWDGMTVPVYDDPAKIPLVDDPGLAPLAAVDHKLEYVPGTRRAQ